MFSLSIYLLLALSSTESQDLTLPGQLYIMEDRSQAQSLEFSANYITNLSDSFVDSHALQLEAQIFPLYFLGFGGAFMMPQSRANSFSRDLIELQQADIHSEILATEWAAHGFVTLLPFIGRWNFFNLLQMKSKVSLQMGAGLMGLRDLATGQKKKAPTYFWRVTHSFEIIAPVALVVGLGGDRIDHHINIGLQFDLPLSKSQRLLARR